MDQVTQGRALRRFRRLHGIKQAHMAEMLGVSQATVSRWEDHTHSPDPVMQARIDTLIAVRADGRGDAALKRLIMNSTLRIHLICDATHRLLAASPMRVAYWRTDLGEHLGSSLWRYATPEIITAEGQLAGRGWFDTVGQNVRFWTGANASATIAITPGMMEWESISLSDGRVGRLTTAIEGAV